VNSQKLVVLGDAVRAAGGAGLDLADTGGDRQVSNRVVFGLAGAMAHYSGVAVAFGQVDGFECLGQGADLVDLDQDRVGTCRPVSWSAFPSRPSRLRPDRLRC